MVRRKSNSGEVKKWEIDGEGAFDLGLWDTPDVRDVVRGLALTGQSIGTITDVINAKLESEGRIKRWERIEASVLSELYKFEIKYTGLVAEANVKASLLKAAISGDIRAQESYLKYCGSEGKKLRSKEAKKAVAGRPVVALPERRKSGEKWEKGLGAIRIKGDRK